MLLYLALVGLVFSANQPDSDSAALQKPSPRTLDNTPIVAILAIRKQLTKNESKRNRCLPLGRLAAEIHPFLLSV